MTTDNQTLRRLAALENKVDHLYNALNVAPPPTGESALSARVLELVHQGNEIEAIRQYRAETGADLAAAKGAIDAARG
jgi:ribosomal protein L7/L12